ncbi:MAG: hypothetical protein NVS3B21_11090 [Acidimicrobiales bacterium]
MAEVAVAAGASKPLLYHYYSSKSELYLAAVGAAAEELRAASTPPPGLSPTAALHQALVAHVDWIDANADAYRAVLQGGHSADADVQAIIEESRADVVARLTRGFGLRRVSPAQRTVMRGWVGFLEGACLYWLQTRDLSKARFVRLLETSVPAVAAVADV